MITRGVLPTLIATWLLLSGPAGAQGNDETANSDPATEQDSAVSTPADQDSPGSDPAPAKPDDSPFDYQSSEEISEDLSVSFPVDI